MTNSCVTGANFITRNNCTILTIIYTVSHHKIVQSLRVIPFCSTASAVAPPLAAQLPLRQRPRPALHPASPLTIPRRVLTTCTSLLPELRSIEDLLDDLLKCLVDVERHLGRSFKFKKKPKMDDMRLANCSPSAVDT